MSPAKRRGEELAERLFQAPGQKPPEQRSAPSPPPAPATRPTARTKPIRHTLDLPPVRHHDFKRWCGEQAVAFGRAEVPGQHVLNELVGLLLSDMRTQKMIAEGLRKRYEGD